MSMSLRALVAAGAIAVILAAAVARRRSAATLPMLVLAILAVLSVYHSAEARVRAIHGLPAQGPTVDLPPVSYRGAGYGKLAAFALERIPPGVPYAIVDVRNTPGAFWLRYVLTPHIRVDAADAHWVLVLGGSPQKAGLRPLRSWRAGNGWLVHT